MFCEPRPVTQVLNSAGKPIANFGPRCDRLLKADVADAVNEVLRGVQEPGGFGYDNGLGLEQQSAGKTGTISRNMAVWFIGYTPNLATASMIAGANSQGHWKTLNGQVVGGSYIASAHGSTTAGPMWGDAMKVVQRYLPNLRFRQPDPRTIQGQSATVPSVYGQSPGQAASVLRRAGFSPVIGPTVDSGYSYGTVAYLGPTSGSSLPTGSTVTIYVSDGTPYVAPQPQPAPQAQPQPVQQAQPQRRANNNKGKGNGGNKGRGNGGGGGGRGRGGH
jgi:membrane peptidoglycan carboxypeptidase